MQGRLLVLFNFWENNSAFLPLVKLECSEETELSLMGVSSKIWGRSLGTLILGMWEGIFYLFSVSQYLRLIGQLVTKYPSVFFVWHKVREHCEKLAAFCNPCPLIMFLVSLTHLTSKFSLYKNQSVDLWSKPIAWLPYDGSFGVIALNYQKLSSIYSSMSMI